MIYLLHGDNQVLSRNKLIDIINQANQAKKEVVKLNGLKINLNQTLLALESTSLFGQEKLVVIENFFSRIKSKEKDLVLKYLKTESIAPDIVFWEKRTISGTTLRWLPKNWQIFIFKTPTIIFKFLESIKPNNVKQALFLLKQSIKADSAEMAFFMLSWQIRQLIIAKSLGKAGLKGAPWQVGKLINQANKFSLEKLIKLYQKLLNIDINIKTGRSLMPLDWHLDLLVASL